MFTALLDASRRLGYEGALTDLQELVTSELERDGSEGSKAEMADAMLSAIKAMLLSPPSIDGSEETRVIQWSRLRSLSVYETMVACNIEGENGKPLFKFRKDGKGLSISETEFRAIWKILPKIIAQELYECALEVNPAWRPATQEETEAGEAGSGESSEN